ncbi:MAG: M13 family metallopeptidase [Pseudomonadales bacterium]
MPVTARARPLTPSWQAALALCLLLAGGCSGEGEAEPAAAGTNVDLSLMSPGVAPGDDFYRYANGAWLDSYELPPDKTAFGNFYELRDKAQDRVQALIESLAAASPAAGSTEQKIGDYYASFMDTATRDRLGLEPIRGELEAIAAIGDAAALAAAFGRAELDNSISPIGFGLEIDRKDPGRFIASLYHAGLGLPERDYYLEDGERFADIRTAYQAHVAELLTLAGMLEAAALAPDVVALETAIAGEHWARADRRNRDLTYNLTSFQELVEKYPDFDWKSYFDGVGATPQLVNVNHPSALPGLIRLINETPLPVWQAYLGYHLLSNNAPYLATSIDDANFAFYGPVLFGQTEQRERWRRAVSLVGAADGLGDAIGQVYVERYFPPRSRALMLELVENLQLALAERIRALSWMGEATKAEALDKLAGFLPKIGYPDEWRDFSDVTIARGDLMGNVRRLRGYFHADMLDRLTRPTDRHEWFLPPQTVNAFYTPQFNAITFPAGILEPPFFDPEADPAVNYGAIGAVIGHEMGHGFDDQGSKSDAQGIQRNWWSDADRARFEARAAELVSQYSAYEPVPGVFVDGEFTLGENIGDLGGINIAYHAYRLSLKGREAPVIDGLTGDQRFFIAYAQLWRSMMREEAVLTQIKSDPHSPAPYRANGVVRNVDAWYDAFGVGREHVLYLSPEDRVSIW